MYRLLSLVIARYRQISLRFIMMESSTKSIVSPLICGFMIDFKNAQFFLLNVAYDAYFYFISAMCSRNEINEFVDLPTRGSGPIGPVRRHKFRRGRREINSLALLEVVFRATSSIYLLPSHAALDSVAVVSYCSRYLSMCRCLCSLLCDLLPVLTFSPLPLSTERFSPQAPE